MTNRINKWIIDKYLIDTAYQDSLYEKLTNAGFVVYQASYIPVLDESMKIPDNFKNEPVGIYGSFEFVRLYTQKYKNILAFANNKDFDCMSYLSKFDPKYFLNSNCIFTTIGLLKYHSRPMFNHFNSDELFIRPNAGFKLFTGFSLNKDNLDFELNSLGQLHGVQDTDMILVSSSQKIANEYRFVVSENGPVTCSSYKEKDTINIDLVVPDNVTSFVNKFIKANNSELFPDKLFICDVALLESGSIQIVEFNAFSHSDLYNCDYVSSFEEAAKILYDENYE